MLLGWLEGVLLDSLCGALDSLGAGAVLEDMLLDSLGAMAIATLAVPVSSAASVCVLRRPLACSPFDCWNSFTAALVFGPAMPSTGPGLCPSEASCACTCLTFFLPCPSCGL